MKRTLYIMAIAIMAFASCTKDNVKEINRGQEIDFRVAATRATETTTATLQDIWVTAISENGNNYFTGTNFSLEDSYFVSEKSYYWPSNGSDLEFYAYAPNLNGITINATGQKLTNFAPEAALTNQVDFIVAHTTGNKTNAAAGVPLVFDHALSQVEVRAFNSNAGYVYKVSGVRLCNIVSVGDFDFSTKKWDLNENEKYTYNVLYDTPLEMTAESQSLMSQGSGNAMLLPQKLTAWDSENDPDNQNKGAYISILVNITTKEGALVYPDVADEYGWIAVAIDTEWESGFKYVYNLDLNKGGLTDPEENNPGTEVLGGEIEFDWTMESWSTYYLPDTVL